MKRHEHEERQRAGDHAVVREIGERLAFGGEGSMTRQELTELIASVSEEQGHRWTQGTQALLYHRLRSTPKVREVKVRGRYSFRGVELKQGG